MEKAISSDEDRVTFIQLARKTRLVAKLAYPEFEYILAHQELTAIHKMIWLIIALKGATDAALMCAISDEELSEILGIKVNELYPCIRKLEEMGLIKEILGLGEPARYTVLMPSKVISHLLRTAICEDYTQEYVWDHWRDLGERMAAYEEYAVLQGHLKRKFKHYFNKVIKMIRQNKSA